MIVEKWYKGEIMCETDNIEFKREYIANIKKKFLPNKGLKPSSVYVRQDTSSVPASFDQIREMINERLIEKRGGGKEDNEYVLTEHNVPQTRSTSGFEL